jgi:hypothetical protein
MTINDNLAKTLDEHGRASAGIKNPKVITLPEGTVLFRFASTTNLQTGANIPPDQWVRGAWWFQEPDYRKIIQKFQVGKLALGTVGRIAGAVQPSWNNMDVSIKAFLLQDMNVYLGKGATQYRDELPNGMFVTLSGWPDIDQIYIPNMRGAAFRGLKVLRKKIISTDSFGFA